MDIHWRVTTRFTEVHGYTLEGYSNTDMNTWIYIGGLQQCLQTWIHGYTLEGYNKVYRDLLQKLKKIYKNFKVVFCTWKLYTQIWWSQRKSFSYLIIPPHPRPTQPSRVAFLKSSWIGMLKSKEATNVKSTNGWRGKGEGKRGGRDTDQQI